MEAPLAVIRQCNRHYFAEPKKLRRGLPIGGRAVRWCAGELYAYWPGCCRFAVRQGKLGTAGEVGPADLRQLTGSSSASSASFSPVDFRLA